MKLTQTCVLAVAALVVVAACEPLSGVAALELAPSPAAQVRTAAAVSGAPPADVQRASTALAKNIAEWDRPQRAGKHPPASRWTRECSLPQPIREDLRPPWRPWIPCSWRERTPSSGEPRDTRPSAADDLSRASAADPECRPRSGRLSSLRTVAPAIGIGHSALPTSFAVRIPIRACVASFMTGSFTGGGSRKPVSGYPDAGDLQRTFATDCAPLSLSCWRAGTWRVPWGCRRGSLQPPRAPP